MKCEKVGHSDLLSISPCSTPRDAPSYKYLPNTEAKMQLVNVLNETLKTVAIATIFQMVSAPYMQSFSCLGLAVSQKKMFTDADNDGQTDHDNSPSVLRSR